MMRDDLTEYLRGYDAHMRAILPDRAWFFTNPHDTICTPSWISSIFLIARRKLKIHGAHGASPRVYDLRNTHLNKIRTFLAG
jgi:hypothetical protein